MSETTIIAIIILIGVFVVMVITVLKSGADAAIKMWGVMGALTGVAFGGITSFYFTNQVNQQEIRQAKNEKASLEEALSKAASKAAEANRFITPLASILKGEQSSASLPITVNSVASIPRMERAELAKQIERTSMQLQEIKKLHDSISGLKNGAEKKQPN